MCCGLTPCASCGSLAASSLANSSLKEPPQPVSEAAQSRTRAVLTTPIAVPGRWRADTCTRIRNPRRRTSRWRHGHTARYAVVEYSQRPRYHQVVSFLRPNAPCREVATQAQFGRPSGVVMRVGGQNVHAAFLKHPIRPISGAPPEGAGKGAGRELHPHTRSDQPLDDGVLGLDPR